MKTARSMSLSALVLAGLAGSAAGQITPVGPFTGTFSEGFNLQTIVNVFPVCVEDRVFSNTADLCAPSGSAHITGGWGFECSIGPNFTPRLMASTGGAAVYTFDAPITRFGGYFGTNFNANVTSGASATFFDDSNNQIGSPQTVNIDACGTYRWNGWSSATPVKRIEILGLGAGSGGGYIMMDDMEYDRGSVITGACCLTNGSCVQNTATGCQTQGGIYRGDNTPCATANCPQPATGACCLVAGCQVLTQAQCTTQSGNYRGDNVTCASANCPAPCANVSAAIGGPSNGWPSTHGQQTNRLFRDGVPDTCVLSAMGGAALAGTFTYDKYDFVNTSGGPACVTVDVNTACTGTNFIYAGAYIGGYNPANPDLNVVASLGGSPNPTAQMSFNVPSGAAFEIVFAEVTPGAGCPNYNFTVVGSCSSGPAPCYANCDGSSIPPILNVSDFICFQTKYAAGDSYANCDNSTTPPVLNVSDFICFQTKYAAGCS